MMNIPAAMNYLFIKDDGDMVHVVDDLTKIDDHLSVSYYDTLVEGWYGPFDADWLVFHGLVDGNHPRMYVFETWEGE